MYAVCRDARATTVQTIAFLFLRCRLSTFSGRVHLVLHPLLSNKMFDWFVQNVILTCLCAFNSFFPTQTTMEREKDILTRAEIITRVAIKLAITRAQDITKRRAPRSRVRVASFGVNKYPKSNNTWVWRVLNSDMSKKVY